MPDNRSGAKAPVFAASLVEVASEALLRGVGDGANRPERQPALGGVLGEHGRFHVDCRATFSQGVLFGGCLNHAIRRQQRAGSVRS